MLIYLHKRLRCVQFLLVALALFSMLRGHWAVLQTIAWGGMIVDYYGEERSLARAATKTFSGEAPCHLCKMIKEGQQEEEREKPALPQGKPQDFWLKPAQVKLAGPHLTGEVAYYAPAIFGAEFRSAPPTPVPKVLG